MNVREIIDQLVEELDLPRRDKLGQINRFKIRSKSLGRFLVEDETLESAGVSAGDTLVLHREEIAGGGEPENRIKIDKSSIGLQLDDLTTVDIRTLLTSEPALLMTLHSYRTSLTQLQDSHRELREAEEQNRQLLDRLKEKNIATVLLLIGQIQIGFGTNLITNGRMGAWFIFLSGLALNLGALFFSFVGFKRSGD